MDITADSWQSRRYIAISMLITFLLLTFVITLFPYSLDDWAWGGSVGIERLQTWFDNYNGRYFGNILVLILTRSDVLRASFEALTLTLIGYFSFLLCDRNPLSYWLSLVLMLALPVEIRAQTIVWTSGFTNYVVPVLLMLIYLYFCTSEQSSSKGVLIEIAGFFILGFISSLIMENITLFNLIFGAGYCIFCRFHRGAWDKRQLAFLAGSFTGAAWMFSNESYWHIAAGDDFYRSVPKNGIIVDAIDKYINSFCPWLFGESFPLVVTLTAFLLFRLKKDPSEAMSKRRRILSIAFAACAFFPIVITAFQLGMRSGLGQLVVAGFVSIYLLLLVYSCFFMFSEREIVLFISAVITLAPLFVVNPITPRTVFPTYALLAVFACSLLPVPKRKWAVPLCVTAFFCVVAYYCAVYYPIHSFDVARLESARQQIAAGETSITIPCLPNPEAVWDSVNNQGLWTPRFKDFYGLDQDVDIHLEQPEE